MSLVDRASGRVQSFHMDFVNAKSVAALLGRACRTDARREAGKLLDAP